MHVEAHPGRLRQLRAEEHHRVLHAAVEREGAAVFQPRPAAELEQAGDDALAPQRALLDQPQRLEICLAAPAVPLHQLHERQDRPQRVVDLVGHAARQVPDGHHLLVLDGPRHDGALRLDGPLELSGAGEHPVLQLGVERLQARVQRPQLAVLLRRQPRQALVVELELMLLERAAHRQQQLRVVPGFADEAEDLAAVDGVFHRLLVRLAGEQDALGLRRDLLEPREQLHAADARHVVVAHHHLGPEALVTGQRGLAAGGRLDLPTAPLQAPAQRTEDVLFIVDQQQATGGVWLSVVHASPTVSKRVATPEAPGMTRGRQGQN